MVDFIYYLIDGPDSIGAAVKRGDGTKITVERTPPGCLYRVGEKIFLTIKEMPSWKRKICQGMKIRWFIKGLKVSVEKIRKNPRPGFFSFACYD